MPGALRRAMMQSLIAYGSSQIYLRKRPCLWQSSQDAPDCCTPALLCISKMNTTVIAHAVSEMCYMGDYKQARDSQTSGPG